MESETWTPARKFKEAIQDHHLGQFHLRNNRFLFYTHETLTHWPRIPSVATRREVCPMQAALCISQDNSKRPRANRGLPSQHPLALSILWHWSCSLCYLREFLNLLPMMKMLPRNASSTSAFCIPEWVHITIAYTFLSSVSDLCTMFTPEQWSFLHSLSTLFLEIPFSKTILHSVFASPDTQWICIFPVAFQLNIFPPRQNCLGRFR